MKQVNKYPRKKKKKIKKAFKRLGEVITEINYHCKKIIDFKDDYMREVRKRMFKVDGDKCVNLNGAPSENWKRFKSMFLQSHKLLNL